LNKRINYIPLPTQREAEILRQQDLREQMRPIYEKLKKLIE